MAGGHFAPVESFSLLLLPLASLSPTTVTLGPATASRPSRYRHRVLFAKKKQKKKKNYKKKRMEKERSRSEDWSAFFEQKR